jgi:PIN domain nuclease of toxin-antitoxin system
VAGLPAHHRDPFDPLLIAQADVEGLALVTRDPVFGRYGVERIEA